MNVPGQFASNRFGPFGTFWQSRHPAFATRVVYVHASTDAAATVPSFSQLSFLSWSFAQACLSASTDLPPALKPAAASAQMPVLPPAQVPQPSLLEPESRGVRTLESLTFGEKHTKIAVRFVHNSLKYWEHHSKNSPVSTRN